MDKQGIIINVVGVVIMTMVAVGLVAAVNPTGKITWATLVVSGFLSILMCWFFLSGSNTQDEDADRKCVICKRYQLYRRKSDNLESECAKLKQEIQLMESSWLDDFSAQDKKIAALKSNWEQLTGFISLIGKGRDNPAVKAIKKRIHELELASLKGAL